MRIVVNRKNILKLIPIVLMILISCASNNFESQAEKQNIDGWLKVDSILSRINTPIFKNADYYVENFINKNDGRKTFVNAVNRAIVECNKQGGGRVIIPEGEHISNGPIHLLSNVNLYLEDNSIIKFGADPLDYTPLVMVRWEGTLCYNYSPLIYSYQQKNIAVTGNGLIDGQTQLGWYKWKRDNDGKNQANDKKTLRQFGNDVTPVETRVFGNGYLDLNNDGKDDGYGDGENHYLRPTTIEFVECENVLIEDLTIMNSPFWTVHPVFCTNVVIRGLDIKKGITNDDGIDPDSCTDVLIENCTINTNDDAIAIKAGRDQDAWNRPSAQNIIIRNNNLTSEVNGFCIGSEMSGGVNNIFVYNNELPSVIRAINFKCNLDRGGKVENVYIKNIKVGVCKGELLIFRMDYHGYRGNNYPTKFNNFFVTDILCDTVKETPFKIVGVESEKIKRVYLKNIEIKNAGKQSEIKFAEDIISNNVTINGKKWFR